MDQWYRFSNNFQKILFYIGGQIDILLMLGAMTALAFLVALINLRKDGIRKPRNIFLLTILIVYALPLISGPNCLRIETARCFSWVIVVPRAFAAHRLMMSGRPTLYLLIATATSGLSYVG